MIRSHKKILHFLLSTALINSSLQPVYASVSENENEVVREAKGRSYDSNCNNTSYDHNKASTGPQFWTTHYMQDIASKASTKIAALLGNQPTHDIDSLVESIKEDFMDEIETLKIYKPNKHTLTQLQDRVWNGEVSPYQYVKGLQELAPFVAKKLLKKVHDQFQSKLKLSSLLVDWNLRKEMTGFLKSSSNTQQLNEGFENLLAYYGRVQNPLDYTETLVNFLQFIQRNKVSLNLTDESYSVLKKNITKAVNNRDQEKYRALKRQRQFSQTTLQELPFYGENVSNDVFNSSLAHIVKAKKEESAESASFIAMAKGIAQVAYKGLKYAIEHPGQAITFGLAGQVVATSAFNISPTSDQNSIPLGKGTLNKPISHFSPRSVKRAIGDDFQINQNITLADYNSHTAAALRNGNAFVVWAATSDIYGRLFFIDGSALSDEFLINQITSNAQTPSVTGLSNGNAFVVWAGSGTNFDVSGRIFSAAGVALSDQFTINQIPLEVRSTAIAELKNDNVFVAWYGDQGSSGYYNIYGRVLSADGIALNDEFRINQMGSQFQGNPTVASLNNGNALVTWLSVTGNQDIYGRIFSSNGTALSDDFGINQVSLRFQSKPSIVSLTNNNVFMTWGAQQNGGNPSGDVYGRIFTMNGTALSDDFRINKNITFILSSSSVTALNNDNLFITWDGYTTLARYQTGHQDIYGRIFYSNDLAFSDEFNISTSERYTQFSPTAVNLNQSSPFVTWLGGNSSGDFNIYGRIFTSNIPGITSSATTSGTTATTGAAGTSGTTGSSFASTSVTSALTSTQHVTTADKVTDGVSNANKLTPNWFLLPTKLAGGIIESLWNMVKGIEE